MGRVKFCIDTETGTKTEIDSETTAKAMIYEAHISPKHALEVCRAIKGKKVEEAEAYLEAVLEKRAAIPFKRHKKKVAHRRGLNKWYAGRYPVKASEEILKLIRNAKGNAEYKGLDPEAMKIWHVSTKKGRTIKGIMPRAFGRATPKNTDTVTIEMVLREEVSWE
ncbi:MAG: 50S ribosomal protein L22 [Methanophagales archaeon]|nr:50S ribosomal protein L22 [Methanophagales archaeon]